MSHWYQDGRLVSPGEGLPSVTTILAVRDNPYLDEWKLRDPEAARLKQETKADLGNRVHEYISSLIDKRQVPLDEDVDYYVRGFINWLAKFNPTEMQSEVFLVSSLFNYAGTADLICKIDDVLWLIDLKTGRMDPGHALQLVAYQQAYYEMHGTAPRLAILQLTPDIKRGYRWKEYDNTIDDWKVFLAHKEIFDWLQEVSPGKKSKNIEEVLIGT